jgi:hypothetical protein
MTELQFLSAVARSYSGEEYLLTLDNFPIGGKSEGFS